MESLKSILESTYTLYHKPQYMGIDPLLCVHGFKSRSDIEVASFLASALAYGRVEIIIRNVDQLLNMMSKKPYNFILDTTFKEKLAAFDGFKHRFNSASDMAILCESLARCIRDYGSVEELFLSADNCHSVKERLDHLSGELKQIARSVVKNVPSSFDYLLPSPSSGSACKRLNMYLRWMVRKSDGIDFGIWKKVSTSILIMPIDTHIAKVSRILGLTKRNAVDWRMAEEITSGLRECDPDDPVRYDFSLCRAGMISFRKEVA